MLLTLCVHMHLRAHRGWQVEGTGLVFQPTTPLLDTDILLDQMEMDSDDDSGLDSVAIGVGVGVGVGGGLLLVGVVVALLISLRRRRLSR